MHELISYNIQSVISPGYYQLAIFSPYILAVIYFFQLLWLLPIVSLVLSYFLGFSTLIFLLPLLIWTKNESIIIPSTDSVYLDTIQLWLSNNIMSGSSDIGYIKDLKSVITAITINPTTVIDQRIKDLFKYSGTIHLLVISGLHFSIVARCLSKFSEIISFPLAPLFASSRYINAFNFLTKIITAIFLLFYGILISKSVPAVRALLSSLIAMAIRYTGRYYDGYLFLHIIASVMIMLKPHLIFNASFQLSFIITAFVLHTGEETESENWKDKFIAYFLSAMRVNFASMILSSAIFGECAPYSLIANMIIVPIFCSLVLPVSIIAMSFGFKFQLINMFAVWLLHFCIILAKYINLLFMSHFRIANFVMWPLLTLLLAYELYVAKTRSNRLQKAYL